MTENEIEQNYKSGQSTEHLQPPVRSKIEILFEFNVRNPKLTFYRAVRALDGSFRMEKRGEHAEKFRSAMFCGAQDCLYKFRESIELYSKITRSKT